MLYIKHKNIYCIFFMTIFLMCTMTLSYATPLKPKEFTLNVDVNSGENIDIEKAKITDDITFDDITKVDNAAEQTAETSLELKLLPTAEKPAETVKLETESLPSKIKSTYDFTQKKYAEAINAAPIVDTISEHEKYGNNGDMFDGISRAIVNGYEAFSNLLNTFITKPKEVARSISKSITAQLDVLGGKLVGL